jgi:hypothetical protein
MQRDDGGRSYTLTGNLVSGISVFAWLVGCFFLDLDLVEGRCLGGLVTLYGSVGP